MDPYGLQLKWETTKLISSKSGIDVVYLIPFSGALRNMPHDKSKLDATKTEPMYQMLGTHDWIDKVYEQRNNQGDLFTQEQPDDYFREGWLNILDYLVERYRTVYKYVSKPGVLYKDNTPIFALVVALTNESKQAQTIANRLATSIGNSLEMDKLTKLK